MQFLRTYLLALIILYDIKDSQAQQTLKITFWIDIVQQSIYEDIAAALKQINDFNPEVSIQDSVMMVTREQDKDAENMAKLCEILQDEGISLVIDWSYYRWQEGEELLRMLGIPFMRVDPVLRPFLSMFSAYIREKSANNVILIVQNAQDKEEAMVEMIEGYEFRSLIVSADDEVDFVQRMRALRPAPSYYAIFARGTVMNAIFERINQIKFFARPAEWHFIFLDPRDRVFKYRKQVEKATKFTINARQLCRAMHMKDDYCGGGGGFTIQRALMLDILRSVAEIARLGDAYLPAKFKQCNVSAESELDSETAGDASLNLFDYMVLSSFTTFADSADAANAEDEPAANEVVTLTYNLNASIGFYSNEHEAVTDLAAWRAGQLHKINETISPAKRFFRVGTTEAMPWSYYKRDSRTNEIILNADGAPIWEGYCVDFIQMLSEKMNFEYEIVAPTSGQYGRRYENGSWDGLVGDLVSGETDFVVAALKMYSDREEVIDFLPPYFEQTGISIVIRKPVRVNSLFKFMTVLRFEVWMSILGALITTAFMIWLLDKYSPYSYRNNRNAYPYPCREFTLRESFWFALTSFTPQGGGEAPKAVSGRLLVAAYWLFVVLMLATFTANLAAFLTVERMQAPVQSLEQLARQSRINYTVVQDSDTHHYFINMKFAEDTLYRMWKELALNASKDYQKFRIWDYPIKEQYGHILLAINGSLPVRDAEEGFRKVDEHENADFAFIHDSSEIKYAVTRNCNFTEVGEVFAEQPYAVAVQQGSHLGDELSYNVLVLQKDRFFEDLKNKYWNSSVSNCPVSEGQEGITLQSLGGVFIATLAGLIIAMITLTFEVICHKKKHASRVSTANVKQVKPIETIKPTAKTAWHMDNMRGVKILSDANVKITPPPSFEKATLHGKGVPITLGGKDFKPREMVGLRKLRDTLQTKDQARNYME